LTAGVDTKRRAGRAGGRLARLPRLAPLSRLDRGWRPVVGYCAAVYLVVRVALFLLSAAAWGLTTEHASVAPNGKVPALTNGWHNAITGWNKWDSLWFLHVARYGYSPDNASAAFFPGYPVLIRLVGYLCFGHLLVAAYIVSNGALLAALIVLYRLTEREYDTGTARRAVLYLALFPTAFFLFDTYSEALFLLTVVGSIALARQGRWGWAAVVGIGATVTRGIGIALVVALAAEAVHQTIEYRRAGPPSTAAGARSLLGGLAGRLFASVVPLAGVGGYLLYWQLRFGDWYRPIAVEKIYWGRVFSPPWRTLWEGLTLAWRYGPDGATGWLTLDFVLVAVGLVLGVWVAIRTRPVYAVYTWASLLFFLATAWPGRPLMSDPRFLVPIFPLVWPLARIGRRPGWHEAVVALSAASLAIVGWLFVSTTLVF
jgi:Mannosyltransferase (PIG-V)